MDYWGRTMIVKIAPNRRDGRSSFKDLAKYMTDGISQSGEPPHKFSWENLTQYITKESVLNAMGDDVEKTIAVEVGNVSSLANAPAEMYATAKMAPRVENPVYHYILSWPEHERPRTEDIFAAARDTLAALGMAEHQYIIAIHANTDNLHAHIEVNRVHPRTFKAADNFRDYVVLHRAAREAEIKYGWHHDNGIFQVVEVNGKKQIVRNDEYVDPDFAPTRPGAVAAEVWNGEESLETWCKREPATDLKRVLKDDATSSWQDIHRVLAQHGLELREAGGGGLKVVDVSEDTPEKRGKPLAVSASAAFRFMKRAALEQRLGPFVPRSPELQLEPPKRAYKRDPLKRLESRLARKAVRDELFQRFKEEQRKAKVTQDIAKKELAPYAADDKKRHDAIRAAYRTKRAEIQSDRRMTPVQKQQAYVLAKMTMLRAREQLIAQIREERAARRELLPPVPTWRAWVEEQAQRGDEAAISALRGMVYQDGRDRKKKEARDAATAEENAILSAVDRDQDPSVRKMPGLIWSVSRNGRVNYQFHDGKPAFRDEGERLSYGRKDVSDDALSLSLIYAADRWKDGIRVSGGDFAFKERVVRMAVAQGITVSNIELRALVRQIEHENKSVAAIRQAAHPAAANSPPSALAAADIEALIRSHDPKARITYADAGRKTYTGAVVAQTNESLAQDLGRHQYVVHSRSAFDRTPEHGERVTIAYRSGKATLQQPRARPIRAGR
ncbi:relaxase/mobilization nuclease domain-containing protein [Cupriavidus gilardii]|nr:relaxase/mobilization nuclease domain-containing protein [Cupriavidus gilardii]